MTLRLIADERRPRVTLILNQALRVLRERRDTGVGYHGEMAVLCMNNYFDAVNSYSETYPVQEDETGPVDLKELGSPVCMTIACVAGWMALDGWFKGIGFIADADNIMPQYLGRTEASIPRLFEMDHYEYEICGLYDLFSGSPKDQKFVGFQQAIDRIENFMRDQNLEIIA